MHCKFYGVADLRFVESGAMLLYKQQPVSGGPGTYPGGRPRAWEILLMYWAFGAAAGSLGYWDLLFSSIKAPPALQSSTGVYTLLGAVAAIAFLRLPLYLGAFRMGRPLSKLSLVIFPLCNALFEGFVLLFIFDAGRWAVGSGAVGALGGCADGGVRRASVGGIHAARGAWDPVFYALCVRACLAPRNACAGLFFGAPPAPCRVAAGAPSAARPDAFRGRKQPPHTDTHTPQTCSSDGCLPTRTGTCSMAPSA